MKYFSRYGILNMEKVDQHFVLLILNCQKYRYKAERQKQTWLQSIPSWLPYYHVIGDPELSESDFLFDEEQRILYVKTPDTYVALPKKTIAALQAIHETFSYQYVFKTDDDQELQDAAFFERLKEQLGHSYKFHYGGNMVDIVKPYLSQYHLLHSELPEHLPILATRYCSGRFYFLSREAIRDLLYKREIIRKEYLEDYAVGLYLHDKFKENMLHINTHTIFVDYPLL